MFGRYFHPNRSSSDFDETRYEEDTLNPENERSFLFNPVLPRCIRFWDLRG